MKLRAVQIFTRKLAVGVILSFGALNIGISHAAFPDDLESGVEFIESNVPGLKEFVNSMEETATLSVDIRDGFVFLDYDKRNVWPRGTGNNGATALSCCVANAWAFIEVDGIWRAATWEFMRDGQIAKQFNALRGPQHIRFSPLSNYFPSTGDVVGFMVAGITRNRLSFNNVRERSNIVFFRIGDGPVDAAELGFGGSDGAGLNPAVLNILLEDD